MYIRNMRTFVIRCNRFLVMNRGAIAVTSNYSSDDEHRQQKPNTPTSRWNAIGFAGILMAGFIGYKNKHRIVPIVYAATVIGDDNKQSKRSNFNFFVDIADRVLPSVVYIEIKNNRMRDVVTDEQITMSNGSGCIIESDGLILTNAHVVANIPQTTVYVRLQDGRRFHGHVETIDSLSDLATIRIECDNLPSIQMGKSSDSRVGEWVMALGSPLALSNTATVGVISSTLRNSKDLGLNGKNMNFIQTDAAITFGNSGGPLINLDGEIIGINTMKVSTGISFAIPIDYAKVFLTKSKEAKSAQLNQSKDHATIHRYMGITMFTLPENNHVSDQISNGVLIWRVINGSPAHRGGLQGNDVIIAINGKPVAKTADVHAALAGQERALEFTVLRGGHKETYYVEPTVIVQ